jgi:hypothetical protein
MKRDCRSEDQFRIPSSPYTRAKKEKPHQKKFFKLFLSLPQHSMFTAKPMHLLPVKAGSSEESIFAVGPNS